MGERYFCNLAHTGREKRHKACLAMVTRTPLRPSGSRDSFIARMVTETTPVKLEQMSPLSTSSTPIRRSTRSMTTLKSSSNLISDEIKLEVPPSPSPGKKAKIEHPSTPFSASNPDRPSTPRSSSKKAMPILALDKPHPAPARWEEQYRLIEKMRKGIIAPVDDM